MMTEKTDYYIVPKFAWNDYSGSGTTKSGKLICTKKFIFVLVEKEDFGKKITFDPIKVENQLNNSKIIDIIDFETELLDIIPNTLIFKIENLEYFQITSNFIVGGMAFKRKGDEDGISFEIAKKSVRKEVIEFYNGITFG